MAHLALSQDDPGSLRATIRLGLMESLRNLLLRYLGKPTLAKRSFTASGQSLPDLNNVHPDIKALFLILIAGEFIGGTARLNFPVSFEFSQSLRKAFGIRVRGSRKITPRPSCPTDINGRPGLAFSGGQDSSLARLLMPRDTLSVFINRLTPPGVNTNYSNTAAMMSIQSFGNFENSETIQIDSDFEYIRRPVGFGVSADLPDHPFPTLAFPLLLTENYNLDSLGFGIIAESFYGLGGKAFNDSSRHKKFAATATMLETIGIKLYLPVAGLSEIGVQQALAQKNSIHSTSCIRAADGGSCQKCAKCLRKDSYAAFLRGNPWNKETVTSLLNGKLAKNIFKKNVVHHENVYRYYTSQPTISTYYQGLETKVKNYREEPHSWMTKYFPPSLDWVPEAYREHHASKMLQYGLGPMSDDEIEWVTSFGYS